MSNFVANLWSNPKKRPFLLGGVFVLLVVLWSLFWGSATPNYNGVRSVIVQSGGFDKTVRTLQEAGVLEASARFKFWSTATLMRRKFKAGYYEFKSGTSVWEIMSRLADGKQTPLRVTILPGIRPKRFADILFERLRIPQAQTFDALKDADLASRLGTKPSYLFGYMMPETYFVNYGTTAKQFISAAKKEFDRKVSADLKSEASAAGLTIDDAVSLASIIEWEARMNEEKPRISGVYRNRLRIGMLLQADPTVQYALMEKDGGIMRRLLLKDYQFEHPYNTYIHKGLPPGALNNPSFAAFTAAIRPEKHDYLYFVADGTGYHRFSKNLGQHEAYADDYRALMKERRAKQKADSIKAAQAQ